jgi:hypothetical protein
MNQAHSEYRNVPFRHTVEGMNIFLFEQMCERSYPDQQKLYQRFRPYKDPSAVHVIDTAIALQLQRNNMMKTAKLHKIESFFARRHTPKDLGTWLGATCYMNRP